MFNTLLKGIAFTFGSIMVACVFCNLFTLGGIILDSMTYQPMVASLNYEDSNASQICILTDAPDIFLMLDGLTVKFIVDGKVSLPDQISIQKGLRSDPAFGPFIGGKLEYDKVCVNRLNLVPGTYQVKYFAYRNYINYGVNTFTISINSDGYLSAVE